MDWQNKDATMNESMYFLWKKHGVEKIPGILMEKTFQRRVEMRAFDSALTQC